MRANGYLRAEQGCGKTLAFKASIVVAEQAAEKLDISSKRLTVAS